MAHEYNIIVCGLSWLTLLFVLHESIVHSNIYRRGVLNYTVKAIQIKAGTLREMKLVSYEVQPNKKPCTIVSLGVRFQFFGISKIKLLIMLLMVGILNSQ